MKSLQQKRFMELENLVTSIMEDDPSNSDLSYEEIVEFAKFSGYTEVEGIHVATDLGRWPKWKKRK